MHFSSPRVKSQCLPDLSREGSLGEVQIFPTADGSLRFITPSSSTGNHIGSSHLSIPILDWWLMGQCGERQFWRGMLMEIGIR